MSGVSLCDFVYAIRSLDRNLPINTYLLAVTCVQLTATVAVVKSRDMHWALLAQKDHKDANLSSLRMLLIADGANPCT